MSTPAYMTHHLQFAEDEDDTLWLSGSTDVVGWLNTRLYDETGDEQEAQGWCPTIVDTSGDGVIGAYTEPGEPLDPAKDMRIRGFAYGIIPNPVDGSIWIARRLPVPGNIVRLELGDNPPETCIAEVYEPPFENPDVDPSQVGPRGTRDRRRSQRGAVDRAGRQRAPRELRPQQVPGAERPHRHRAALPRGVDAVPDPGSADEGGGCGGQRRLPTTTTGWTSSTRWGWARTSPSRTAPALTRCWPCCRTPASGSRCGCPIRSASTRGVSTAASTMPARGGRAAASGPATTR